MSNVLDFPVADMFDDDDDDEGIPEYIDENGISWGLYTIVFAGPRPDGSETSYAVEIWAVDQDHANSLVKHLQTQKVQASKVVWEEEL